MSSYSIAVCIPAFEFPEGLVQTLNCLMRQSFSHFQVVIVDDSETDDVERICRIYQAPSQLNLKYIRRKFVPGGPRVASASNIAWMSADLMSENGIVVMANSHILVREDWVKRHFEYHARQPSSVLIAPYREGSWDCPSSRSRWGETPDKFKLMRMYGDSLRKEHLEAVGGWDEEFDGEWGFEDVELAYRLHKLGLEFVHGTDVEVVHLSHPLTHAAPKGRKLGLRNTWILSKRHPELRYIMEQWAS